MTEAYPLQWPPGWKRTTYPTFARFGDFTFYRCCQDVKSELKRLGAKNIIISTNIPLKQDGDPYSRFKKPDDCGVAVYFDRDNKQQCIPCDKWNTIEDNLRAIFKTIEALRGLERWGAKEMVDAAFSGFKALPFYEDNVIIGELKQDYFKNCNTLAEVELTWKHKRKYMHPDVGGTNQDFSELTYQYNKAKNKFK